MNEKPAFKARLFFLGIFLVVAQTAKANEVDEAKADIKWALDNRGPCTKLFKCLTYFDEWKFEWSNGTVTTGPRVTRAFTSAHDCIVNAVKALRQGDRQLAVGWVVATQIA